MTLDDVERIVDEETLLICDANDRPIGLAGIMGGQNTEISASTTQVVLETAWFEASGIMRSVQKFGLRTEASARFERGVDPRGIDAGIARFVEILALTCPDLVVHDGLRDERTEHQRNKIAHAACGVFVHHGAGESAPIQALAGVALGERERDAFVDRHAFEQRGHRERRDLTFADRPVHHAVDEPGNFLAGEGLAVAFPANRFLGQKHRRALCQRWPMVSKEKPAHPTKSSGCQSRNALLGSPAHDGIPMVRVPSG